MNCFTFIFVKRLKWHGCTWRRTWKWTIEKTCLQENIDGKHICGKLWQDLHFASKACARKASVCWVHDVIEWKLKEASFSLHFLQSSNVIPGNSCCHLHWGWFFQRLMIQISDWKITICIQWLHLICWQSIYQVDLLMAYRHIPTMTDSHHGGFLSVMIMVGICQVTKSHHWWWL